MKTQQQIENEIAILEGKRKSERELYTAMNQIDMQSLTGAVCRKLLAKTEGKITALKWVLK